MARIYDRDPYAILGISSTATTSQVKEAYHRLARQYHPDLNKDPRTGERMKDINWAYDILGDPQERSLYDYWRSSSIRTDYSYPGWNSADWSTGNQAPHPPSYDPYRRRTYSHVPASAGSSTVGCSPVGVMLLLILVITNLVRAIGPSLSQRPSYDYFPEYRAAQTAQMQRIESTLNAFSAAQNFATVLAVDTPEPLFGSTLKPSPVARMREQAEPTQQGWRARIVPGTWEYHYISTYFPELMTPNGLSDDVTDVIYHQLDGYEIKTRSSGEYWLHISPYDNGVSPEHIPPRITATPPVK